MEMLDELLRRCPFKTLLGKDLSPDPQTLDTLGQRQLGAVVAIQGGEA